MNCNECQDESLECYTCEKFEQYVENTIDVDKLKEVRKKITSYKPSIDDTISGKVADFLVSKVGTMYCFYSLAVLTTIPLIFPLTMSVIQYISSGYLQLILLPLIMVAGNRTDVIRQQVHDREWKISVVNSRIEELIDEATLSIEQGHQGSIF